MNPVYTLSITKEAFVRLTELRDIVEELTGDWIPLNQLCSTLICQCSINKFEEKLDEKTA